MLLNRPMDEHDAYYEHMNQKKKKRKENKN